jgi:hypothetical protein
VNSSSEDQDLKEYMVSPLSSQVQKEDKLNLKNWEDSIGAPLVYKNAFQDQLQSL